MKLDLSKSATNFRLTLEKRGLDVSKLKAQVAFDLDVSGSYEDEHKDGHTNSLLTRLVPWAMVFDPNGEIDVFTFSDGPARAHHVGVVDESTVDGYVRREIIEQVPGWNGGTHYSHVLLKNLQHFGWVQPPAPATEAKKPGLMGRLFGKKPDEPTQAPLKKDRSLIIFNTDGECQDEDQTEAVIQESQDRGDEVYFLFLGYSNQAGKFKFLEKLGRKFNNSGLVTIANLQEFVALPDDKLNELLLQQELIDWLKAA